jgi:NADH/NAD ratio-sensing transcriptional regulator Rex
LVVSLVAARSEKKVQLMVVSSGKTSDELWVESKEISLGISLVDSMGKKKAEYLVKELVEQLAKYLAEYLVKH